MSDIDPINVIRPDAASGMEPGFEEAGAATSTPFDILVGSRLPNSSSLVVGSSCWLRHQETSLDGATIFTVSGMSAVILQPDGSVFGGAVSISAVGGEATTCELRALWTPTMGGMHRVTWSFTAGGTAIERVEIYFVAWTDVWAIIRRRLRESGTSLPDVDIDGEIAVTVRQLVDRFSLLQAQGGYEGLSGLDQERFDTAAAYLTAISMRFYRMKTVPIGELSSVKLNQNTFQFASQQQKGEVSIEEQWLHEAIVSLGRVTAIQTMYASAAASFKPFLVSGPTRYKLSQGHYQTLLSETLTLLTDRWDDGVGAPDYYDGYGQI